MTREEMIRKYNELAAAHKYIVGFTDKDRLYYAVMNGMIRDDILKLDKAAESKGGMMKIRVRMSSKVKAILLHTGKAILCGTAGDLEADKNYNRGENFERIITELLTGNKWEKDNVPFTDDGDLTVDGIAYQLKFEKATFINEAQMMRMQEAA